MKNDNDSAFRMVYRAPQSDFCCLSPEKLCTGSGDMVDVPSGGSEDVTFIDWE